MTAQAAAAAVSGDTNTLLLPGHSAMNFSVFLEHRCGGGGGVEGAGAVQRPLGTAYPPSTRPASQGNESVVRLCGGGETGEGDSGVLTLLQCSK